MNQLDDNQITDLLGRLASTMPDNPGRAAAVQRGVRRRRQRRVATRASVGLTFVAGLGFVVTEARRPEAAPIAAASTSDTKAPDVPDNPCADAAGRTDRHSDEGRIKVAGTITVVDGDTISLSVDESQPVTLTEITATISADAAYIDGSEATTMRPTLEVGDHVAFGAVQQPDGSYVIDALEAHVPDTGPVSATKGSAPSDALIDAAKKAHALEVCGTAG